MMAVERRQRDRFDAYAEQTALFREMRSAMVEDEAVQPPRPIDMALVAALQTRSNRMRQTRFGAGIAAALALLIAGGLTWRDVSSLGSGDAVVAASVLEFPFGGMLGTSLAGYPGDGETSINWLSAQLSGEGLRLPDLKGFGLKSAGGAVVEDAAVPAIRLVWADDAGNRLSLYAGIVSTDAQQALAMVPEGHVSMHWRRGDVVYALVAPTQSRKLLDVMRAVAENWTNEAPSMARPVPAVPTEAPPQRSAEQEKPVGLQPVLLPTSPTAAGAALPVPDSTVPPTLPGNAGSTKELEKPKPL